MTLKTVPRNIGKTAAVLVALMACSRESSQVGEFQPTHFGNVEGRVFSVGGTPLDSVLVSVHPPAERDVTYQVMNMTTAKNGEYRFTISRMSRTWSSSSADTATVTIRATGLKKAYDQDGHHLVSETPVFVTFVPYGRPGPRITANLTLQVP